MAITANDIKLLASARMTDEDDGGGPMTGTALQDGAENNVFPDISSTDRAFGRLALRKVYAAVLNAGTDTLLGGHVVLDDMPDDANVHAWAVLGASATEDRAGVLARLQQSHWEALGPGGVDGLKWADAPYSGTRIKSVGGAVPLSVGSVVFTYAGSGIYATPVVITGLTEVLSADGTFSTGFPGMAAGDRVFEVTYDGGPIYSANSQRGARLGVPSTTSPRVAATRPVTGTLAIGATGCDVDTVLAKLAPKHLGVPAGAASVIGIDADAMQPAGLAAAFRAGDGLVIHHTASVAAAVYANGNTVNFGRGNLASVRPVDANGAGITTGWTVDLVAGVATVTDISGWAQPVTWKHAIEEVVGCARTGYPEVSGGSTGSGTTAATAPITLTDGLTMYCGRPNVGSIRVISKTGQDITDLTFPVAVPFGNYRWFDISQADGTATFHGNGLAPQSTTVAAFITSHSPVTVLSSGSYAVAGAASAAQADLNHITFNRPLTRAFPAGTLISSMLLLGDMQAQAGAAFAQESWTQVWADARIGSAVIPQYQQVAHPIVVSNDGAVSERWAVIFTTSTTFRVVGESAGQIATGDVNSPLAPMNPATGQPYFTLSHLGWGGGWSAGNVLRFNTLGANAPVWLARAVLPSAPNDNPDSITAAVRGDVDA